MANTATITNERNKNKYKFLNRRRKMKMMKKMILTLLVFGLLFNPVLVLADSEEAENITISTSITEIALDGTTPCTSYMFQSRDGSDFYWYKTATSTEYFTVKDGAAIVISFNQERKPTTLFWAKAASGTPVIEVFVFNHNE